MATGASHYRFSILGLLAQHPLSGYDLKRVLNGLSWLIGSPSFGSLYPALHALQAEGLVAVETRLREGKPPRKIYSITEEGTAALEHWLDEPGAPQASLKGFVMRLLLAGVLEPEALTRHLVQRQTLVAGQLARLHEEMEHDAGQQLATAYQIAMARSELEWIQETLANLSAGKSLTEEA
ncbi:MAG: PadR family transcriptional regulator [Anaerolineae bacterium]|nr:PadR family transcriptional regulator [Anaerolineae bacterium]